MEETYQQCKNLITQYVEEGKMMWLYRMLVFTAIKQGNFHHISNGDKMIAFAMGRQLRRLRNVWKLEKLAVDPAYLRQGFGTRLLKEVLLYHPRIQLDVMANNTAAIEFYQHFGFTVIGDKVFGDNKRCLIMRNFDH